MHPFVSRLLMKQNLYRLATCSYYLFYNPFQWHVMQVLAKNIDHVTYQPCTSQWHIANITQHAHLCVTSTLAFQRSTNWD